MFPVFALRPKGPKLIPIAAGAATRNLSFQRAGAGILLPCPTGEVRGAEMQGPRSRGDRSHAQPRIGEHGEDPPLASALRGGAPSLWRADLRPADARNFPLGTESQNTWPPSSGLSYEAKSGLSAGVEGAGFALTKPPVFLEDNCDLSAALRLIGSLKRSCCIQKIRLSAVRPIPIPASAVREP